MTGCRSAGAIGVGAFLSVPTNWRILVDLAGIAIAGGMFVVPLYAILQTGSPPAERSRIIAANNVVNAIVTVAMVGMVSLMLGARRRHSRRDRHARRGDAARRADRMRADAGDAARSAAPPALAPDHATGVTIRRAAAT